MDDAKNNLGPKRRTPIWFRRVGVLIENWEEVGVLQPEKVQQYGVEIDGLAAIERVLATCLPVGEWHALSAIVEHMTPDEAALFPKKNSARALDKAFDGRTERTGDAGKLYRQNRRGNIGWECRLVTHAPQGDHEEQTSH
jgi:hypothetical protein